MVVAGPIRVAEQCLLCLTEDQYRYISGNWEDQICDDFDLELRDGDETAGFVVPEDNNC